jgi:hypothetical protein
MEWPPQQCYSLLVQCSPNDKEFSGKLDNLEVPEVAEELENLEPTGAKQAAIIKESWSTVAGLDVSEVMDDAALDTILEELNSPEPSEEMKAAILKEFLGASGILEVSDVMDDAVVSDSSEERDYESASEAAETPLMKPRLDSPSSVPDGKFACPFKDILGCERTFSHPRYAKNHAKVHTHHIRCHYRSCRSRFDAPESLERHLNGTHGYEYIADLDSSVKGPLVQIDGKYNCRFRELLGCEKTFSQNGHANRHALLHCKEAISCNVRGCRKKFMKKENWEEHFWTSHHQMLD